MKKGVAGVRLCDQSGCYDRWPCARHGTLSVVPEVYCLIDLERRCPRCNYQQCGCPVPAAVETWCSAVMRKRIEECIGMLADEPDEDPADSDAVMQKWLGEAKAVVEGPIDFEIGERVRIMSGAPCDEAVVLAVTKADVRLGLDAGGSWWFSRGQIEHLPPEPLEYYAADEEPPVRPGWRRMGGIYTLEANPQIQVVWAPGESGPEMFWRLLWPDCIANFGTLDIAMRQGEYLATTECADD